MFDKKEYMKEYRKTHRKERAKHKKQYKKNNREKIAKYMREYYRKNKEKLDDSRRQWAKRYPEKVKAASKKSKKKVRLDVLRMLSDGGKPVCVRCGCDDIRLLEINHINGGGSKEKKGGKGADFCFKIKQGKRKTDDLNVLCRVCNAWHALELKYGKLPFKIKYEG